MKAKPRQLGSSGKRWFKAYQGRSRVLLLTIPQNASAKAGDRFLPYELADGSLLFAKKPIDRLGERRKT